MVRGGGLPDAIAQWQIDADGTVVSGPEKVQGSDGFFMANVTRDLDVTGSVEQVASLFRLEQTLQIKLGALSGHGLSVALDASDRSSSGAVRAVGYSRPSASTISEARAVVWSVDASGSVAGPVDLGLPEAYPSNRPSNRFESALARSLNSQGWIAGYSTRADGTTFATLWLPESGDGDDELPPGEGPAASFDFNCSNSAECRFVDTSTGQIASWSWGSTTGFTSGEQNVTITFAQEGSHVVNLVVTDEAGLGAEASATVACRMNPRHGLRCS